MVAIPVVFKQYIEQRDGAFWVTGTRVSLDSVVYAFLNGAPPENIVRSFPLLTLEQVYGAIAFYLANRDAIDAYLKEGEAMFEELSQTVRVQNADLYAKLTAAKAKGYGS